MFLEVNYAYNGVLLPLFFAMNNTAYTASGRRRTASLACVVMMSFAAIEAAAAGQASGAEPVAAVQETAPATARVRLFGQNGTTVDFYQNSSCVGGKAVRNRVSGGVGDAFSSLFGSAKNTSIGMKETPTTQQLSQRDGFASKAYFREYEIPANQPFTVSMFFQSVPKGMRFECRNLGGTFTPESGKEYEIALKFNSDLCLASVEEIRQDEQGKATLVSVDTAPSAKCD